MSESTILGVAAIMAVVLLTMWALAPGERVPLRQPAPSWISAMSVIDHGPLRQCYRVGLPVPGPLRHCLRESLPHPSAKDIRP